MTKPSIDQALTELSDIIEDVDDADRHRGYLEGQRGRYRETLEALAVHHPGGPVYDIGADPFHLSWLAKRCGYELTAVDMHPDRHADLAADAGVDLVKADIQCPDELDEDKAGTVLLTEVFEHLFDPPSGLETCRRVLRNDGVIILSTPNLQRLESWVDWLLWRGFDDAPKQWAKRDGAAGHMGHVRMYTPGQIRVFVERAGFDVVEHSLTAFGGGGRPASRPWDHS